MIHFFMFYDKQAPSTISTLYIVRASAFNYLKLKFPKYFHGKCKGPVIEVMKLTF